VLLTKYRFTAANVRTNVSTAARRSRPPVFYALIYDNIPARNLSKYAAVNKFLQCRYAFSVQNKHLSFMVLYCTIANYKPVAYEHF